MDKLKKVEEVEKTALRKHRTMIGIELLLSMVTLGMLIYYIVIGDPDKRVAATIGTMLAYIAPFAIERIFKVRFAPLAHVICTIFMTLSLFMGSTLNFHNTVEPYDEIMHFLFGYFSCLTFFYVFISWKDYDRQTPLFVGFLIFVCSMGLASLWEIMEFSADVLLGQTSLGGASPEIIEQGVALGYSGVGLQIYGLMHGVGVWDTITDMCLHLCGTILFCIEFAVYRHIKRPIILEYVRRDYNLNHAAYYELNKKNVENLELVNSD